MNIHKILNKRGAQLLEEGLLLALAVMAIAVLVAIVGGIFTNIKDLMIGQEKSLEKFLVEVLRDDLDTLWNNILGGICKCNGG
ncbi:MAG: hypothetical protein DRJ52_00110 [Thermoprotei archaeon]|nr:MAG: hypothetical protein DRJ52_00110 [Thermoprotei archaeon]